jgi:hypothetical protein
LDSQLLGFRIFYAQTALSIRYWLELLVEARGVPLDRVSALMKEANEIVAMTGASIKTLRYRSTRAA